MLTNSNFYIGDSSVSRLYQGENLIWDASHPDILLEYIANGPDSDSTSTKNVYFDTGVLANANTKCEMKTAIPAYKGQWFCGGCTNGFIGFEIGVSSYHRPYTRIGSYLENGQNTYSNDIQLDVPYTTVLYHDGTNQKTIFNTEVATSTSGNVNVGSFPSTQTVILFARGLNGTIYSTTSYSGMKIYYTKFWDNNNLIRFYIPVLHYTNGEYVPCLYDKVNDTYIYNLGTDTPTYKISGDYLLDYIANGPDASYESRATVDYNTGLSITTSIQTYAGVSTIKLSEENRNVGVRGNSGNYKWGFFTPYNTTFQFKLGYLTNVNGIGEGEIVSNQKYNLGGYYNSTEDKVYFYIDSSVYSLSLSGRALDISGLSGYTIKTWDGGSFNGNKIYYMFFGDSNIPLKTYVPVLHNNQAAFLDLNSGTYIYNIGTDVPYYQFKR